ncbi:MAG: hypothetical protein HOP15_18255 [Planctomycetes bacterium]|nr:hypothetical protein [Planctomycetota bacterium]
MNLSRRSLTLAALAAGTTFLALGSTGARAQPQIQVPAGPNRAAALYPICADTLRDTATGNCLSASTVPTIGKLFPMSQSLHVNASTGFVGIGTTFPFRPLEVNGALASCNGNGLTHAVVRPSTNGQFGVIETIGLTNPGNEPVVTNLLSSVSIAREAGAIATIKNGSTFLVTLSTPANNTNAGYVSVRNNNAELAGINGGTGVVFGSSKSFVQPHPLDASKEIQYVSLEGPEHGVYFRGTATLVDGRAELVTPASFRLVARAEGLTVSLTPLGPSRGLYVAHKGLDSIAVRENEGGKGDGWSRVEFDFLVMGERSALPTHVAIRDNVHFVPPPGTQIAAGQLPGAYRELMIQNGTLNADGSVNDVNAMGRGWRLEQGGWTGGALESAAVARD